MAAQTFNTRLVSVEGKNVTGIVVPDEIMVALGGGQRPRLEVTVNSYEMTIVPGRIAGKAMIGFSAARRAASGLSGGDAITDRLELASGPEAIEVPPDLNGALADAGKLGAFSEAAPSRRKEWVRQVMEAKSSDTRGRRIAKVVDAL